MGWDTTFDHGDRGNGYLLTDAQGHIVAEEVLQAAGQIERTTSEVRIEAEEKVVSCPAKTTEHLRTRLNIQRVDTIKIHFELMLSDHIAISSVSGEVVTSIYRHIKKDSPFTNTLMITMANDKLGYIVMTLVTTLLPSKEWARLSNQDTWRSPLSTAWWR